MSHRKYGCIIGRFQSPHMGHHWLIQQELNKGNPVLILVRDVFVDEKNPFSATEIKEMLEIAFREECIKKDIVVQIIPDICSFSYGRTVGYDVICHEDAAPEHIKAISATEIRRQIRAGEDGWRDMVMPGVEEKLKEKFK